MEDEVVERRSPRSGDLVRALADDRDEILVEGTLHLRYVPILDYVQVRVIDGDRSWSVVPGSIDVIGLGEVGVEDLERSDPVVDDPGWQRIRDLRQAGDAGLLSAPRKPKGGSWADLFDGLAQRAQVLIDAGWALTSTEQEDSREHGDSVSWLLERNGIHLELELDEHGQLVATRSRSLMMTTSSPSRTSPSVSPRWSRAGRPSRPTAGSDWIRRRGPRRQPLQPLRSVASRSNPLAGPVCVTGA